MSTDYDLDLTDYNDPKDLDAFDFVKGGQYHAVITEMNLNPVVRVGDNKGNPIDGIEVSYQILNGTTPGQRGKSLTEVLYAPSDTQKDGGKFCKKRLAKFGLATGLISPAQLGQRISINWEAAVGRQIVIHVAEREYTKRDGTKGVGSQLDGLHMYAVTDPVAQAVPKDAEALAILGITPAAAVNAPMPAAKPAAPPAAPPSVTPTAAAVTDPFGDI